MDVSLFDYELPEELIAQKPVDRRDSARMVLVPPAGPFQDRVFGELGSVLPSNSLIVLNDTKVFPARLTARKESSGLVEVLLVRPDPPSSEPSPSAPGSGPSGPGGGWTEQAQCARPLAGDLERLGACLC